MEQVLLGRAPTAPGGIDAVHVAVKAMTCSVGELAPGTRVNKDGLPQPPLVGIVDPFRELPVKRGELYWLCLFPGTVTSIKHYWTHPAFAPRRSAHEASTEWLENYCKHTLNCELSDFLSKLDDIAHGGDSLSTHGDYNEELREAWPEICYHYYNVSGNLINPSDWVSFSCSC